MCLCISVQSLYTHAHYSYFVWTCNKEVGKIIMENPPRVCVRLDTHSNRGLLQLKYKTNEFYIAEKKTYEKTNNGRTMRGPRLKVFTHVGVCVCVCGGGGWATPRMGVIQAKFRWMVYIFRHFGLQTIKNIFARRISWLMSQKGKYGGKIFWCGTK